MIDFIVSIFVTTVYVICMINAGMLFFIGIKFKKEAFSFSSLSFVTIAFLLGLGILSNIWLLFGLYFRLGSATIWLTLAILLLIGTPVCWKEYRALFIDGLGAARSISNLRFFWRSVIYFLVGITLFFGIASVIVGPNGDSEAFYMAWPKIIAFTGTLDTMPLYSTLGGIEDKPVIDYVSFSQIGLSSELHFAVLIAMCGASSATFLVWFVAVSIIFLIVLLCESFGLGSKAKTVAVTMLLSTTAFTQIVLGGNVNLLAASYGIASVYLLILFIKSEGRALLAVAALLISFSVVAKFSYLVVLLPIVAGILVLKYLYRKASLKESFINLCRNGFLMIVVVAACVCPHILKNYELFGEPFAPFYFFRENSASLLEQKWFSPDITRHIVMTYPIALTFGQYPMQGGGLSPLVGIFSPLLFLVRRAQLPNSFL